MEREAEEQQFKMHFYVLLTLIFNLVNNLIIFINHIFTELSAWYYICNFFPASFQWVR